MSTTHSVEHHLHVTPEAYDQAIRGFVPHYDELIAEAIELLRALAPKGARVLDLGGGTGALSQAVLDALPDARVTLLDIDPQMLAQAKRRLGARVTYLQASFAERLPESDAIVASLSLHHVHDMAEKEKVYAGIHAALAPGGVFLNLDATVSADPRLQKLTLARWVRGMGERGIAEADARRHLAEWEKEDKYMPLHAELAALRKAGFAEPECFFRRGSVAVYGGLKAAR